MFWFRVVIRVVSNTQQKVYTSLNTNILDVSNSSELNKLFWFRVVIRVVCFGSV